MSNWATMNSDQADPTTLAQLLAAVVLVRGDINISMSAYQAAYGAELELIYSERTRSFRVRAWFDPVETREPMDPLKQVWLDEVASNEAVLRIEDKRGGQ